MNTNSRRFRQMAADAGHRPAPKPHIGHDRADAAIDLRPMNRPTERPEAESNPPDRRTG